MDPATITLLIGLAVKYGPDVVFLIIAQIKKLEGQDTVSVADIEAVFLPLKPYSSYGIDETKGKPVAILPVTVK